MPVAGFAIAATPYTNLKIALGHTILIMGYYVLTRKQPYQDLGTAYFDKLE